MIRCNFCNREANTVMSNAQHELYCKSNPNKKIRKSSYGMLGKKGSNQFIKGTAKPVSEETRIKRQLITKNKVWDDEARLNHSIAMKKAVENHPESYTSSNRGRTKQITYNGIKFQGSWELQFYQWCEANNISCVRNTEGFKYHWNGERTYYPDFYLTDKNVYVEVKGYETDRDTAKWNQFPKKLLVIKKADIIAINECSFELKV